MHNTLIKELDQVLDDFVQGKVLSLDYEEYVALERIAAIVNRHRKLNYVEPYDFSKD